MTSMPTPPPIDSRLPIRSGWNVAALLRGKPLTDRQIARYQKLGYYNPAFLSARREFWAKRAAKRLAREGNFEKIDGRLIFRP